MRGADALVRSLVAGGVRNIFTLSGNHIMPVFDAALDTGVRLFHTRHEAAAVHMADAWARITGEVGIALVTGGPGHANAVSALYTALMAESPVVLISGHAPHDELGRGAFQEMRQAEMAAPVVKASWTSASAGGIGADIARAARVARSGRPGPVHLSVPTDVLESSVDERAVASADAFVAGRTALTELKAIAILGKLTSAERPLILAGPASLTRAGRSRLAALESATGVPCVGMESPRGIRDPCLGIFGEMLAQADCVLLLGKRLDFTLAFGKAPGFDPDCTFVEIDADAVELERTRQAVGDRLKATAVADVGSAIDSLIANVRQSACIHEKWTGVVRGALAWRPPAWDGAPSATAGKLHPVEACAPLRTLLGRHPESVLVCDGGEFGQWAQACLAAPHRVINGVAGSIGSALPFALAARLARPDVPVVALLGDGTFGFHMAEIDTAVRYALPFVAVVGNDARWNAEYQIQLTRYGPERLIGCALRPLRYDIVTQALGGHGEHISEASALPQAIERAHASALPACIDIAIEGLPAPVLARGTPMRL